MRDSSSLPPGRDDSASAGGGGLPLELLALKDGNTPRVFCKNRECKLPVGRFWFPSGFAAFHCRCGWTTEVIATTYAPIYRGYKTPT